MAKKSLESLKNRQGLVLKGEHEKKILMNKDITNILAQ